MSMYFAPNNNFVCTIPAAMEYVAAPQPKPQKTHHWYDFITDWSGENLWHNLVMIGEVIGGLLLAPLTAGTSEGAALASIAATAAVETGVGIAGAAANTGIDAAYGHATWGSGLTNFGSGIVGGLAAGGFQLGGFAIKGALVNSGRALGNIEKVFNDNMFGTIWGTIRPKNEFDMFMKDFNDVVGKGLINKGYHSSKLGMESLGKKINKFYYGKNTPLGNLNVFDQYAKAMVKHTPEFSRKIGEKGAIEVGQRYGNEETKAKYFRELYKGGQGATFTALGEETTSMFLKYSAREITELEFVEYISQLPRAEQLLFKRTLSGFKLENGKIIESKDLFVKIKADVNKEVTEWGLEKPIKKYTHRELTKEIYNYKESFRHLREPSVLKTSWKEFKEAKGFKEKFNEFIKLTSTHDFNEKIVQRGQLLNPTDAGREVARKPYLWLRAQIKKWWTKITLKNKMLNKFSKFANQFKKFIAKSMASGHEYHVFPGSSWILGYRVLQKIGTEAFIEIQFQREPTNDKPPVFTWTNKITLKKWKLFPSPGHFYLRYFAQRDSGVMSKIGFITKSFVPMTSLRNMISLVSNITHTIRSMSEEGVGNFFTEYIPSVLKTAKRNGTNRVGWLAGDIVGMIGTTMFGGTVGRIAKGLTRKTARYGIIPMVSGTKSHWDKAITETIRREGLRKVRRTHYGRIATSHLRGQRKLQIFRSVPSALSGGTISFPRGKPRRRR